MPCQKPTQISEFYYLDVTRKVTFKSNISPCDSGMLTSPNPASPHALPLLQVLASLIWDFSIQD